jgi:cytoskeletal protein RodZ
MPWIRKGGSMFSAIRISHSQLSLIRIAGIVVLTFVLAELGIHYVSSAAAEGSDSFTSQPKLNTQQNKSTNANIETPSISTSIQSNTSSVSSNNTAPNSSSSVSINGQSIAIPDNGEVHQTVLNGSSQTHVDISTNSTSSSQNHSSSSTNIQLHTDTNIQTESQASP